MTESYRSYVIRVRRRIDPPASTRLDVEDLLGGRRSVITGDAARNLADDLENLVTGPGPTLPETHAGESKPG